MYSHSIVSRPWWVVRRVKKPRTTDDIQQTLSDYAQCGGEYGSCTRLCGFRVHTITWRSTPRENKKCLKCLKCKVTKIKAFCLFLSQRRRRVNLNRPTGFIKPQLKRYFLLKSVYAININVKQGCDIKFGFHASGGATMRVKQAQF